MKRLTKGEKIRRYMEAHPTATPKKIAEALGVKVQYVHTLRSADKKARATGKPILRQTAKFLGVTMAKDDVTKLTPEQTARLVEAVGKPKTRMPGARDFPTIPETVDGMIEKARRSRSDPVNHPYHYKAGGIETIDFIEAKGLGYRLGNVVKYITRADHKGNRKQDLEKAMWYLKREIEQTQGA